MSITWTRSVGLALTLALVFTGIASAQESKPELTNIRIVVGGKSALFYLPLSVTEQLGYFKDVGLNVEIDDVSSGARTLQAVVSGSAEIGTGTFDHSVQMQAKGQPVVSVVQMGRYPGFVFGMVTEKASLYRDPKDLKGMKIGVTGLGSSTQFMAAYMLVRSGLNPDTDVAFVSTGMTSTAVAAARRAEIDAIVTSDPMASVMTNEKLITVIADTRTAEGTQTVYGGPYPGGAVYATRAFIEKNPKNDTGGGQRVRARITLDCQPFG